MIRQLILIFICFLQLELISAEVSAQDKQIKFLSYNILQGMRLDTTSDNSAFASWVRSISPDVLAIEEATNFTQKRLEELAISYGHRYATLLKEDGWKYPVALTSRFPILNVQKITDNMDRGFIIAQIKSYHIIALHLSPFTVSQRNREADLILETIHAHKSHKKWIIMGDFNALTPIDSLNYSNGKLLESYKVSDKKYQTHNNLPNGKLDFKVVGKFLADGFIDAVFLKKGKEVLSSRPTKTNPRAIPSRIDYIFVSSDLKKKVQKAEIIKADFTDTHSDHYPVYMEIRK